MSQTLTLEVPEALAHSAQAVASRTGRRVEEVLAEWLSRAVPELAIEQLPDEEVLAIRARALKVAVDHGWLVVDGLKNEAGYCASGSSA